MTQPVQTIPIETVAVPALQPPLPGPGPIDPHLPPGAAVKPPESPAKMKYLALLWGLMIVAATTLVIYFLSTARATMEGFSGAFAPKVKYNTVLTGAIGQLNNNPKLVVLTADLQLTVTTESTTTLAGVPMGSAKAEITVPAKIQYYVPVKELTLEDFYFDESGRRLVVKIPRPILDNDVVAIETDPDKIERRTEFGWSPFSVFKGQGARNEAMRHLKEAALAQGQHELLIDRADANAKKIVAEQLDKVSKAIKGDGMKLEVEFRKPK